MRLTQIDHVFHPSDFTQGDEAALAHALRIALDAKAHLQLLHVKEPQEDLQWSDFPHVRSTLVRWGVLPAGAVPKDVARLGLRVAKVQRTDREPVEGIVGYILEHNPDLVVLSTHQRQGLDRLLHQSTAEPIARRAHAATLFVPRGVQGFVSLETGQLGLRNILIPVDKVPNPQVAMDAAALLVRSLHPAEVHFILLHVGPDEDRPQVNIPSQAGWSSEYRTWQGNVVDHILASALTDAADCIVMGTRGHHGFLDALRGSTTEMILRGSPCPLLSVPATD